MASSNNSDNSSKTKNVTSATSGGETVNWDVNGNKADDRAEQNDNLTNIVNGRVRPYFQGCRIGRQSGW